MKRAIISLSGGLDSTCLLLKLLADGYEVRAYSFDYGQKHSIELKKVRKNIRLLAEKHGLPVSHSVIDLRSAFADSGSSLMSGSAIDIPHGHYASENMKSTVVENRNIIFSAIIFGKALAWAKQVGEPVEITQGIHAGDHCFTADTKIMTTEGLKTVKELRVGDRLYSVDPGTGKTAVDTCIDIIEKGTNDTIFNIKIAGDSIRLTSEHKVYVLEPGGKIVMKKAGELVTGDKLCCPNRDHTEVRPMPVSDIVIEHGTVPVYDISVKDNHNFFAGEYGTILISNSIYPDCTDESRAAAEHAYKISNWDSDLVSFTAPFVNIDKGSVLGAGLEAMHRLGFTKPQVRVVLKNTHTCYDPDEHGRSCGKCGSCTERLEAFEHNGMKDPVPYQE